MPVRLLCDATGRVVNRVIVPDDDRGEWVPEGYVIMDDVPVRWDERDTNQGQHVVDVVDDSQRDGAVVTLASVLMTVVDTLVEVVPDTKQQVLGELKATLVQVVGSGDPVVPESPVVDPVDEAEKKRLV